MADQEATLVGETCPTNQCVIWYSHIDEITDEDLDFNLIAYLQADELQKVKRFIFKDDQKRAILSILLQRALIRSEYGVTDQQYELKRTKEVRIVQTVQS